MGFGLVGAPWPENVKTISSVPSQSGSLTYNGSAQSPAWDNYDTSALTLGGATVMTNAGTYTATFTPKEGYEWLDGTTGAKSASWTISKAVIAVPTQKVTLTYTGSTQSPSWNNYDSGKMTLGGVTSGTNAGSYNAAFTPAANYQWSDGTTSAKSVAWTISRAVLTVPSQSGTLAYNGSSQSPTWNHYDSSKMTIGGTTTGTAVGSYTATFTPKSNYQWSGGSTSAKSVTWTSGAASLAVPSQKGTLTYNGSSQSPMVRLRQRENDARRNLQRNQRRNVHRHFYAQERLPVAGRKHLRQERQLDDRTGQPLRAHAEWDACLHRELPVSHLE